MVVLNVNNGVKKGPYKTRVERFVQVNAVTFHLTFSVISAVVWVLLIIKVGQVAGWKKLMISAINVFSIVFSILVLVLLCFSVLLWRLDGGNDGAAGKLYTL